MTDKTRIVNGIQGLFAIAFDEKPLLGYALTLSCECDDSTRGRLAFRYTASCNDYAWLVNQHTKTLKRLFKNLTGQDIVIEAVVI